MKKVCFLAAVISLVLLFGCSKEKNEDLIVPNHDFTVQEWADFERGDKKDDSSQTGDTGSVDEDDPDTNDQPVQDTDSDTKDPTSTDADNETPPFSETAVVVIDPGHGGQFDGAVSGKLVEKELTLKVSKYLKEYLESNYSNVEVYLTRETDTEFSSSLKDDLEDRTLPSGKSFIKEGGVS